VEIDSMDDLRKMIQETHDSTIRQEGTLNEIKARLDRGDREMAENSAKIRQLEDEQLVLKTRLGTLTKVWAGLVTLGGMALAFLSWLFKGS
jgi:predicted nuclease with TOPRIM domain